MDGQAGQDRHRTPSVTRMILWKPWTYLVSDKVRTEGGRFVTPPSLQTVHKNEHLWLEK